MDRKEIYLKKLQDRKIVQYNVPVSEVDRDETSKSKNIERVIFAPDPVTKLPMSDLSLPLEVANDPEVRMYVDKWLHRDMSAQIEKSNIMNEDDFDFRDIKSRREDRLEFINGLRERVQQAYEIKKQQVELKKSSKKEKGDDE